jgi:hypothetical protein
MGGGFHGIPLTYNLSYLINARLFFLFSSRSFGSYACLRSLIAIGYCSFTLKFEEFLKMQTRTMKDNLIIAGIPEFVDENTETVIKTFINDVLKVPGDIPLHVAHRLRKHRDRRPRSIVAKFEHRKDRDRVLEVVKTGVLNETDFSVNEQYPVAVNERRQASPGTFKTSFINVFITVSVFSSTYSGIPAMIKLSFIVLVCIFKNSSFSS